MSMRPHGPAKHWNTEAHRGAPGNRWKCVLCAPLCPLWFKLLRGIVYLPALATLACGRNDVPRTQVEVADSAGVRITTVLAAPESLPLWTLESEPRLVLTGTETGVETAFAFVGPVRFLSSGALVVGDVASSRLLIYDAGGRFLRFLGRRGEGPGEISRLESIAITAGDTLATFDRALRRLSFWHAETGFIRSVNLADGGGLESWPADAWPWHDSLLVVFQIANTPQTSVPLGSGVRRWPMRAHVSLRDRAGRLLRKSPTFDAMYSGLDERGSLRLPFSNRPFVATGDDRIYFGSGDAFEITYLDASFAVRGEIRWTARDEPLTKEEVERVRGEAIALISRRPLPPNPFAMNFAPEILPANRPSIGRVFVDRDGRLWVERFEALRMGTPSQVPGDQWSILRDDGQPVAILALPPMTRLEDVRGDEVVVVRRDSLDVQSVAVHRLRR
jgi:hypothetical protein